MVGTIKNIFKVADLRKKILFTLLMLVIFRIGAFIPVPGVNKDVLSFTGDASLFGVMNIFGGGALERFSIFALGVMPYITASIIVQLLQMDVVPKFAEWAKQGEVGRRKLAQFTRYGTIVLGFIQALALSLGFNNLFPGLIPNPTISTYLVIAVVLTAGTAFLMWLGEQITAYGVGNGISVIIFAGIVAAIPTSIQQIYLSQFQNQDQLFLAIAKALGIILLVLALIVFIIYVQQGVRKIPIQYAKRVVGTRAVGGQTAYLPLKVNSAGVIPVIFAVAIFYTPRTIAGFFSDTKIAQWLLETVDYTHPIGTTIYALLIIAFTYFYTFIQVNPEQMAENLKKQGGYIPGTRPGLQTQQRITSILYRLTFVGALFLAFVAVVPVLFNIFVKIPQSVQIGGTSLLIVVGVALDTMKQIDSHLVKRNYKGFIK